MEVIWKILKVTRMRLRGNDGNGALGGKAALPDDERAALPDDERAALPDDEKEVLPAGLWSSYLMPGVAFAFRVSGSSKWQFIDRMPSSNIVWTL
jgi:hypothetical protein